MMQKCKQCGQTFELTESEIAFYNRKGLDLPKRCACCRKKNREERGERNELMPGIQQVREVDPGYKRGGASYDSKLPSDMGYQQKLAEVEVPFWKQEQKPEKKEHPFLTFFIILGVILGLAGGGMFFALRQNHISLHETASQQETVKTQPTYYLNTYRKKFHKPSCESVQQMNPENREAFYGTREEAIARGYSPCQNCNP